VRIFSPIPHLAVRPLGRVQHPEDPASLDSYQYVTPLPPEFGNPYRGPHHPLSLGAVAPCDHEGVRIAGKGQPDHPTGRIHFAFGHPSDLDIVHRDLAG
jgi:hypothetical protein